MSMRMRMWWLLLLRLPLRLLMGGRSQGVAALGVASEAVVVRGAALGAAAAAADAGKKP